MSLWLTDSQRPSPPNDLDWLAKGQPVSKGRFSELSWRSDRNLPTITAG
jgi:hypothetical protein